MLYSGERFDVLVVNNQRPDGVSLHIAYLTIVIIVKVLDKVRLEVGILDRDVIGLLGPDQAGIHQSLALEIGRFNRDA